MATQNQKIQPRGAHAPAGGQGYAYPLPQLINPVFTVTFVTHVLNS